MYRYQLITPIFYCWGHLQPCGTYLRDLCVNDLSHLVHLRMVATQVKNGPFLSTYL